MAAAAAAAAATWVHIQLGAHTMLVLGLGMLLSARRTGLRRILTSSLLYLLLVAPTLAPQWALYVSGPSPLSPREFLNLHAVLRQPQHLIPSSWPGSDYFRFFLLIAMAALAADWRREPHRTVLAWCAIILALCVVGTVFVEVVPVKLIIKMQLFRETIFIKFFAVLYVAKFLLQVLEQEKGPQKACALAILAIQNFAVIGSCAALLVALRKNRPWLWGVVLFAAGFVAGVTAVATASLGAPIPMFWHSFAVGPRGVWVGLATLAALAAVTWLRVRLLPAALVVAAVALRIGTGLPYYGYAHAPADDWYQFCQRIRAETPRDAVFINPPYYGNFLMFAERAEVADFKCAPSIEKDLVEWKRRIDDLSGENLRCSGWMECSSELAGAYSRLREKDFLRLADKYRAQFAITTHHAQHLDFPVRFRSGDFVLYSLPGH
ncbi:MAG: hypothetical protein HY236_03750 [Acidobacteria bacterium]|nr:hypothetical protein [Acidobacteriota bacterium]